MHILSRASNTAQDSDIEWFSKLKRRLDRKNNNSAVFGNAAPNFVLLSNTDDRSTARTHMMILIVIWIDIRHKVCTSMISS